MDELREVLLEKTLALREAGEDFDEGRITFLAYMARVKYLAEELNEILDKWAFVEKQ